MIGGMDEELQKVAAATTLCHLCTLKQLEGWVAEAKNPVKKRRRRRKCHEVENH